MTKEEAINKISEVDEEILEELFLDGTINDDEELKIYLGDRDFMQNAIERYPNAYELIADNLFSDEDLCFHFLKNYDDEFQYMCEYIPSSLWNNDDFMKKALKEFLINPKKVGSFYRFADLKKEYFDDFEFDEKHPEYKLRAAWGANNNWKCCECGGDLYMDPDDPSRHATCPDCDW